ncbi:MAG TPA: hypothetical protein VKD72_28925 [Gemmataceae bacterium]|nr:hypothetical protein [Gemmataceae bacterium]
MSDEQDKDRADRLAGEDTADRGIACAVVLLLFALAGSGICGGFLLRR